MGIQGGLMRFGGDWALMEFVSSEGIDGMQEFWGDCWNFGNLESQWEVGEPGFMGFWEFSPDLWDTTSGGEV